MKASVRAGGVAASALAALAAWRPWRPWRDVVVVVVATRVDCQPLYCPPLTVPTGLTLVPSPGPAVINVWATWCTPCLAELPDFQRVSEESPDVRFVGVDATGFDDDDESVDFLADLGVTYPQYVDPDGEFAAEVEITELPATLVIDADGKLAYVHQGQVSYDDLTDQLVDL